MNAVRLIVRKMTALLSPEPQELTRCPFRRTIILCKNLEETDFCFAVSFPALQGLLAQSLTLDSRSTRDCCHSVSMEKNDLGHNTNSPKTQSKGQDMQKDTIRDNEEKECLSSTHPCPIKHNCMFRKKSLSTSVKYAQIN